MTWNHRIVKHQDVFGVKEVYYENGTIISWSADFIPVVSESFKDLQESLEMMKRACSKPILLEQDDKLIEIGYML